MKLINKFCLIVLLIVILGGCSPAVNPRPTQTLLENPTPGYPGYTPPDAAPLATANYPAPSPITDSNYPDKIEIPTPQSDSGVVAGILLVQGAQTPYLAVLYLGDLVYSTNSPQAAPMVTYSPATDTHAQQDKMGRFVFDTVKPGKYALVIWTPVSELMVTNPDSDNFIQVDVVAGQVTDLGNLFVK